VNNTPIHYLYPDAPGWVAALAGANVPQLAVVGAQAGAVVPQLAVMGAKAGAVVPQLAVMGAQAGAVPMSELSHWVMAE
jgi:hypothetical protein